MTVVIEKRITLSLERAVRLRDRPKVWVKRMGIAMGMKEVLREFKTEVEKLYGEKLKNIVLYGSWARGDATGESDIDLLIVLEGEVIPGKEIDKMIDIITEINLRHGVLISVYPLSEKDYSTVNSPLLMNVRREGVPA